MASIPKFITYAIDVCTQISYEKFGPPQGHACGCRGLKISLNKCAFLLLYRYLTKLVLEVIGVASIPTFIIDAIAVCTQISYEKFGHPQGLKQ